MGNLQRRVDDQARSRAAAPTARPPVEQRRSPRYAANWAARYRLDSGDAWRACRVVDVSFEGAALELRGVTLVDGIAGPIDVQIASAAGEQVGVTLRGVVRRHVEVGPRRIIAGIEFGVLRPEERSVLHLLVGLRSRS